MTNRTDPGVHSVLGKLGKMTAIRDTQLVEQSLLRTLGPMLGIDRTALYLTDENGGFLRALIHSRSTVIEADGGQRLTEQTEELTSEPEMCESLKTLFESIRLFDRPSVSPRGDILLIGYPVHGQGGLRGYFVFERDHEATTVEDAVIQGILEVFTNYYSLLDTSQRDRLTGLLNRYSLEINLDRLWSMLSTRVSDSNQTGSRRNTQSSRYWIGVLDIDHFKRINDNHGHIIGDEVLIMVTRVLKNVFRRADLLYRYGGEEFIAVIVAKDLESATLAFERARAMVEHFLFPQVGHITISGGFCGADPHVLSQEVINRADRALYEAKNAGRNRMFHYDTLVEQGILKEATSGSIDLF